MKAVFSLESTGREEFAFKTREKRASAKKGSEKKKKSAKTLIIEIRVLGVRSMDLQNTVKEALNALYHHPDDAVRAQADRWLQDFQHSIDAWQVTHWPLRLVLEALFSFIFSDEVHGELIHS